MGNFKLNYKKVAFAFALTLLAFGSYAQTTNTVLCSPTKRTLTSAITGTTYQWFRGGVLVAGATAKTYDADGVLGGALYTVVAINEHGCASDASNPVAVYTAPVAVPTITSPGFTGSCTAAGEIVLTGGGVPTGANVPAGLTYAFAWRKVGSTTVLGTAATYTIQDVAQSGQYTLTLSPVWKGTTLATCSGISAAYTVTVNPLAAKATIATVISGFQTADEKRAGIVCELNTVTFTGNVTAGANETVTGLTYQWFKDGVAISGATAQTLVLTSVKAINNGSYTVKTRTTTGCEATSDAVVLDVKARLAKPTITFAD